MKKKHKIVFFIEPDWVFGRIHYDLIKALWPLGFDCQLLPWNRAYTLEEFREIEAVTDAFVTNPHGWAGLYNLFKVHPSKCIVVSHAKRDYEELIATSGLKDYPFKKFACVSTWLIDIAKQLGIEPVPEYVPLGINYDLFCNPPSKQLQTVGFASSYEAESRNGNVKRGYLAKQAADNAGLRFVIATHYHNSFVTMPGFYPSVDCIICSSTEEGAGFPIIEGGAAGKLIISTRVGYWNTLVTEKGADFVDMDPESFVEQTTKLLLMYKDNHNVYTERCAQIQQHAQSYDWNNVIHKWIDLLS